MKLIKIMKNARDPLNLQFVNGVQDSAYPSAVLSCPILFSLFSHSIYSYISTIFDDVRLMRPIFSALKNLAPTAWTELGKPCRELICVALWT